MLFLLRAMFWLSIVFASISWPSDPREHVPKKLLDFFDQDMTRSTTSYGEVQGRERGARQPGPDATGMAQAGA
jgi:hypothetical protein